jgi:hypothetical protein
MTAVQSSVLGTWVLHCLNTHGFLATYTFSFYGRCCDYALLLFEYWADAPEIQRSADLYEDLIKCCVADAMSEVELATLVQYNSALKA